MPNVYCDQCRKTIEDRKLAYFSDAEKNLDFCSEECYSEWNRKDWKEIHPDFTPELQKEWEDRGATYEVCKLYIKFGCQPQEAGLARYLAECQKNNLSNDVETAKIEYPKWKELGFDLKTIMSWKKLGFTFEQAKEYLEFGLTSSDYFYYCWLKNSKQLTPKQVLGKEQQLREEYNKTPRGWLEQNYPNKKTYRIYINKQLERELDCSGYDELREIFISTQVDSSKFEIKNGFYYGKETQIIHCIPAQKWLEQNYPKNGTCIREKESDYYKIDNYGKTRDQITKLNISNQNLESSLELSDFPNLEELNCSENNLTSLNVSKCNKLKILWCSNNHLTQIIYLANLEQLTNLYISNNDFSQDLSIFSQFKNLGWLNINNNNFTGSLKPLKDLKLWKLDISHTDINSGVKYLPNSLEYIRYGTYSRPDCKLSEIQKQLDQWCWLDIHEDFIDSNGKIYKKDWLDQGFTKEQVKKFLEGGEWNKDSELIGPKDRKYLTWFLNFKKLDLKWALENEEEFRNLRSNYGNFGTCKECQQPNININWCHSCNVKHFQQDFKNWTSGNPNIDAFIQKCQLEATSPWNVLEWMPYEQFTNIKHIANGGFGKVEKAEWKEGSIKKWSNKYNEWKREGRRKTAALKTLTNSQNLNADFLTELTLYKAFENEVSNMVPCYGISKDREGNYILVMGYMEGGNLREYLKKDYWELGFESKLDFLQKTTQGLRDIHRKKLVHKDFHSGNIIVQKYDNGYIECRITDLGLSKPVNETDSSKVFGVVPYVAPEVLQGKPYTQSSDIYSLGIIAYEILTCLPPFATQSHGTNLALKICQGLRPQFPPQLKYPEVLVDLIKRCWDGEPKKRPTVKEISKILSDWFDKYGYHLKEDTILYQQIQEAKTHNEILSKEIKYPTYQDNHIWHSKPINTQEIAQLFQESEEQALVLELKKIEQLINQSLTDNQKELVSNFLQTYKERQRGNKEITKKDIKELKEKLRAEKLTDEDIEKIVDYCSRLVELEQEQFQAQVEVNTNNNK